MFKKTRYGLALLCLALSLITGTANASFEHCVSGKAAKAEAGATASVTPSTCDVTFSVIPTFTSPMNIGATQSGTYTITNNTPAAIKITYIQIQVNDALPAVASTITTASSNSCVVGSLLAAGASCNIQVNLVPLAAGTYNRVLQVGLDSRQVQLDSPAITAVVSGSTPPGPTPPVSPLNFTVDFSILAGTTVTNTGPTVVNGNVGVWPGTAITGFPPGLIVNGIKHPGDAVAQTAQSQLTTAYNTLAGDPCPGGNNLTGQDLGPAGGRTLTSGTYCFNSSAQLTGALTLNGPGPYIFQIGSTLTTGTGASVNLINGATAANVFWQVGSSATLGTNTAFVGNILALTSITLNAGVSLNGRALARNGAVTLSSNAVSPH